MEREGLETPPTPSKEGVQSPGVRGQHPEDSLWPPGPHAIPHLSSPPLPARHRRGGALSPSHQVPEFTSSPTHLFTPGAAGPGPGRTPIPAIGGPPPGKGTPRTRPATDTLQKEGVGHPSRSLLSGGHRPPLGSQEELPPAGTSGERNRNCARPAPPTPPAPRPPRTPGKFGARPRPAPDLALGPGSPNPTSPGPPACLAALHNALPAREWREPAALSCTGMAPRPPRLKGGASGCRQGALRTTRVLSSEAECVVPLET